MADSQPVVAPAAAAQPRNQGSFDKADPSVGTGLVGAPAHGDVMQLQIQVNSTSGLIDDARWKTFGCDSAIAASQFVSEWLKGKTLTEAAAIGSAIIVEELSLTADTSYCASLAESAIQAAVDNYNKKHPRAN